MGLFKTVYAKSYEVVNTEDLLSLEPGIANGVVEEGKFGPSVRFNLKSGGYGFVSLSRDSSLEVGDEFPLAGAKVITLAKEGEDDITRVIEA